MELAQAHGARQGHYVFGIWAARTGGDGRARQSARGPRRRPAALDATSTTGRAPRTPRVASERETIHGSRRFTGLDA